MTRFLKWWLFIMLVVLASIFAGHLGVYGDIWENDKTKLSFVILGIFVYISGWCGIKSWNISRFRVNPEEYKKLAKLEEIGWFASETCLNIGMIGTVSGFIMMLYGFSNANIENIDSIKELLASMSAGMSTALYTTLAGLICSQLLKIQYFNLSRGIAERKSDEGVL